MKVDKRTERSTGKYASRQELQEAIDRLAAAGHYNKDISVLVGVSTATVSRMRNGDKGAYKRPISLTPTCAVMRVDAYWKPTNQSFLEAV